MHPFDLLDEYILVLKAANRSQTTMESYTHYTRRFQTFLLESDHDPDVTQLNPRILREFISWLQDRYAAQTVQNTFKGIRTLLLWAVEEEIVKNNPTRRVNVPKVPQDDYETFSVDEVGLMLRACHPSHFIGVRDYCLLMVLFDCGLRISEVINLKIEDVHIKERYISVFGKGSKARSVPVSNRTLQSISKYLRRREKLNLPDPEYLFLSRLGTPLTRSGGYQIIQNVGKRAGVKAYPHKLRHTFAVHALRNDANLFDIQDCLGHTSLTITKRYARQTRDDLVEGHKNWSPANRLPRRR